MLSLETAREAEYLPQQSLYWLNYSDHRVRLYSHHRWITSQAIFMTDVCKVHKLLQIVVLSADFVTWTYCCAAVVAVDYHCFQRYIIVI